MGGTARGEEGHVEQVSGLPLTGLQVYRARHVVIFRIPGAWEEEGFKILDKYGIEYCDRSVSMHEAARRAVEKIQ